jgi:hypothetical protein
MSTSTTVTGQKDNLEARPGALRCGDVSGEFQASGLRPIPFGESFGLRHVDIGNLQN